jgi:hypothetical protein
VARERVHVAPEIGDGERRRRAGRAPASRERVTPAPELGADRPQVGKIGDGAWSEIGGALRPPVPRFAPIVRCTIFTWR